MRREAGGGGGRGIESRVPEAVMEAANGRDKVMPRRRDLQGLDGVATQ